MFTGLIAEIAIITEIRFSGKEAVMRIACPKSSEQINVGDSIAISGVCLTVTIKHSDGFSCDLSAETLERSTFSRLTPGEHVNLELALQANGRLGGHFVQGHVDAIGNLQRITRSGSGWMYKFSFPASMAPFMVEKGSIAVDGISLTIASLKSDSFSVAVVPHTYRSTTMHFLNDGDSVNLETDILAKYVARLFDRKNERAIINEEFLKKHGFVD